ncbi:MAG: putative metal-binding motif-containing protein [Nitrospirae bacterium]|nr:putative metal-binding motif-containing protein [Nitrospirota bacterium]
MSFIKDTKGIALIQLVLLVILIGVLVAYGIRQLGPEVAKEKRLNTKNKIDAAVQAVVGFAAANDHLPTIAQFPGVVRDPQDVWGNDLVYRPDDNLDNDDSTICGRSTTDTVVNECGEDGTCVSYKGNADVAFLIFSIGENLNRQTRVNVVGASATVQTYEYGLAGIDDDTGGINRPEPYKDIVVWMGLNELKIKAGCLADQFKIVNSSLPSGTINLPYIINLYAQGGVSLTDGGDSETEPDYEWCVTRDLPNGLNYLCNGSLAVSADCRLSTATWNQCTNLTISGTPDVEGVTNLPIYARDGDSNITQKVFGLLIRPTPGLHVCEEIDGWYRVWNNTGNKHDFQLTGESCYEIAEGDEITVDGSSRTLSRNEVINQYATSNGACNNLANIASFNQAVLADINADCCIKFTDYDSPDYVIFVDRTCPGAADDNDHDGYTTETDCNDSDPDINPGVSDIDCDNVDEDCDGTPDDGYVETPTSCGVGVCASTGQMQCQSGSVVDTCSVGSPSESPESSCSDGFDNDCDGLTDGADPNCITDICAAGGMTVLNSTGSNKKYKINLETSCNTWTKNTTNIVGSTATWKIYSGSGSCSTLLCTKTYSDFRAVDVNNNCNARITGSCTLGDN